MPEELTYQKLSWALFKECISQPLVYLTAASGLFSGIVGWIELAFLSFTTSAISLAYYFLMGKKPRRKIQERYARQQERLNGERKEAEEQRRLNLQSNLDSRGKEHLHNLQKLENIFQDRLASQINQPSSLHLPRAVEQVAQEVVRTLENRVTYTNMLRQFNPQQLQNELATVKSKYEREQDLSLRNEYRQTISTLNAELNDLKKLKTAITRMEQDMVKSLSTLRSTVLLLSQPESSERESRLNQQVAKLTQEVEVAKRVNEELASFQLGRRNVGLS